MSGARPTYHLFTSSHPERGWRFELRAPNGDEVLTAEDAEPCDSGERLDLLAVIRGLESLDHPSRVLVSSPSRHVRHGIRFGIEEWRENAFRWEWNGQWTPIKNDDLWRRLDHALKFHQVHWRWWRIDAAHLEESTPSLPTAAALHNGEGHDISLAAAHPNQRTDNNEASVHTGWRRVLSLRIGLPFAGGRLIKQGA